MSAITEEAAGTTPPPELTPLRPGVIRLDGGTQLRAETRGDVVEEYAEALADGKRFPPPVVFHDGTDYWPGDGHHRIAAAIKAGLESLDCVVRPGTVRDAILYSAASNAKHGLRRSNADKRKAVETVMREWPAFSNREVARRTATTHSFVNEMRREREGRPRGHATKKPTSGPAHGPSGPSAPRVESRPTPPEPKPNRAEDPPNAAGGRRECPAYQGSGYTTG